MRFTISTLAQTFNSTAEQVFGEKTFVDK